jgi:DNA-binding MarR family transcriptional regulator
LPASQRVLDEISRYREELSELILDGVEGDVREQLVRSLLKIKSNLTAETALAPLAAGG